MKGSKRVSSIHHFTFAVSDLDRSIDFYTNVVGFRLRSRETLEWARMSRWLMADRPDGFEGASC